MPDEFGSMLVGATERYGGATGINPNAKPDEFGSMLMQASGSSVASQDIVSPGTVEFPARPSREEGAYEDKIAQIIQASDTAMVRSNISMEQTPEEKAINDAMPMAGQAIAAQRYQQEMSRYKKITPDMEPSAQASLYLAGARLGVDMKDVQVSPDAARLIRDACGRMEQKELPPSFLRDIYEGTKETFSDLSESILFKGTPVSRDYLVADDIEKSREIVKYGWWGSEGIHGAVQTLPALLMGSAFSVPTGGAGGLAFWGLQGQGSMYKEAKKLGVSENNAVLASAIGAVPYAFLEKLQVTKLMPGVGGAIKKSIADTILKRGIRLGGRGLLALNEESLVEGLQGIVEELAPKIAKGDQGLLSLVADGGKAFVTNYVGALKTFPFLLGLRAGGAVSTDIKTQNRIKTALLTPEGAQAWATINPIEATKVARHDKPSRKHMVKSGIGVGMNANERALFSKLLRNDTQEVDTAATEAPTPPVSDSVEEGVAETTPEQTIAETAPMVESEEELSIQSLREDGVSEEQIEKMRQSPMWAAKDTVSEWSDGRVGHARINTVSRVIEAIKSAAGKVAGVHSEIDLRNIGGLNKKFGHQAANKIIRKFTDTVKAEVEKLGGNLHFFRHGGDEFSITGLGISKGQMDQALASASDIINQYVKDEGLADIPHHKAENDLTKAGTGIYYNTESISPDLTAEELFSLTDAELEVVKKGAPDVTRSEVEAPGVVAPAGETGAATDGTQEVDKKAAEPKAEPTEVAPTEAAKPVKKQQEPTKAAPKEEDKGAVDMGGTLPETSRSDWAMSEPESKRGGALVGTIKADSTRKSGKHRIGVRTISEYLNKVMHTVMLVGKSQLSAKHPAHFQRTPAIIRTKTGATQLNFHEAGHAMSNYLRDTDATWYGTMNKDLTTLTQMEGSMASAKTAEEGVAEFVRRYIADYKSLPSVLITKFESKLKSIAPDMLQGIRDAHRAYSYHRSRPISQQIATLKNDKGKSSANIVSSVIDTVWSALYSVVGGNVATHLAKRKIWKGIVKHSSVKDVKTAQKLARAILSEIEDTPADFESAYQAMNHIPQEAQRAIWGAESGPEGIRILATGKGFGELSDTVVAELKRIGFYIPDAKSKHGDYIYLSDNSIGAIKKAIGDDLWSSFQNYGQYRAALERFTKKGQLYPGVTEGLDPKAIREWLKETEKENPSWDAQFKEVNKYMDQLLLVSFLSGELDLKSVSSIKTAWADYWPLPRQVEGRHTKGSGAGTDPSSGIRQAFGSMLPFKSLDEAIEVRTKMAIEAYYTNRMMNAFVLTGQKIEQDKRLPYDARKAAAQIMLPLRLDMKKVATMSEAETQQVIADFMNAEAEKMGAEGVISPDDVAISTPLRKIWRGVKPSIANVVRVFRDGKQAFYQVNDPMLFDLFSGGKDANKYVGLFTKVGADLIKPWKRALTQNLGFAFRNLYRDPSTALGMAKDSVAGALVPFYYTGVSLLARVRGKASPAISETELLSKTLNRTSTHAHKTIVQSFVSMLAEGISVPGYSEMTTGEKLLELPGQLMSANLPKVIDIFNWVSGGRALSNITEALPREGAYLTELRRGFSEERAQMAYDKITGNFGQKSTNQNIANVVRAAGFLNPAIQIMWGYGEQLSHPDNKVKMQFIGMKIPALMTWGAIGAAMNYLLMKAIYDDDELEEILAQMGERKDNDRLGYMAIGGKIRLPYDYGLTGSAASFGWNVVEEQLIGEPIKGDKMAWELLDRARDLPGVTDVINPFLKVAGELWMNHNLYFDEDIVPSWMEAAYPYNPELQAWPSTPEIYKMIGRGAKVSPLQIQYFVKNVFTSMTDDTINMVDKINRGEEVKLSDAPLARRIIQQEPRGWRSKSVQKLSDLESKYKSLKAAHKDMKRRGVPKEQLDAVDKDMNDIAYANRKMKIVRAKWKLIKKWRKNKNPDMDKIREKEREMTDLARDVIRKEEKK